MSIFETSNSSSPNSEFFYLSPSHDILYSTSDHSNTITLDVPSYYISTRYGKLAIRIYRNLLCSKSIAKLPQKHIRVDFIKLFVNAFLKLKEAVESSATPSDDELTSLINEYYNEESVNLPQEGKWYKLASINSEGNSLFFTMDSNGKLAFTKDQNQALAFLAKNEGTKLSLQDQQGKFFFVNGLTDDK